VPRFAISSDVVAPPLTFEETAKKYGVPKAEVKRVRTFLGETLHEQADGRGSRKVTSRASAHRTTKTRRRRAASKSSR